MDLLELAHNTRINHWPPHLGVTTDAEKIAYLADALRQSEEQQVSDEELRGEMQSEIDRLRGQAQDFEDQLDEFRDDLEALENKLEDSE